MELMDDYFEGGEHYRKDFKALVITPDEGVIDMDLEKKDSYASEAHNQSESTPAEI